MVPHTLESVRIYQDERLREAEEMRLVAEALADRQVSPLTWVGRRMIQLGNSLVEIAGERADGTEERTTVSMN
jgi:hypothetical protein